MSQNTEILANDSTENPNVNANLFPFKSKILKGILLIHILQKRLEKCYSQKNFRVNKFIRQISSLQIHLMWLDKHKDFDLISILWNIQDIAFKIHTKCLKSSKYNEQLLMQSFFLSCFSLIF